MLSLPSRTKMFLCMNPVDIYGKVTHNDAQ